jgi:hypothetical protein
VPTIQPGDAEVAHLHPPIGRQQDVGRLDVAMHDPLGVRPGQGPAKLGGDAAGLPRRQRPAPQAAGQVLALDELGDVVETLGGMADVVDLDDARVADPRQHLGLAFERRHPLGVLGPPWLDHLDRHRPRQPAVQALVDAPERPLADDGVELVTVVQSASGQVRRVRHGHKNLVVPGAGGTGLAIVWRLVAAREGLNRCCAIRWRSR